MRTRKKLKEIRIRLKLSLTGGLRIIQEPRFDGTDTYDMKFITPDGNRTRLQHCINMLNSGDDIFLVFSKEKKVCSKCGHFLKDD